MDISWLKKYRDFTGLMYSIGDCDRLSGTIIREMKNLFPGMEYGGDSRGAIHFELIRDRELGSEGYQIGRDRSGYLIQGNTTAALLYGMYGFHRLCGTGRVGDLPYISIPDQSIRMLNHWDNFDGSIERGYAGASIFYDRGRFRKDSALLHQYAGLLASVGINAVSINNVNVHKQEVFFITAEYLREIRLIADIFSQYGIRIFLSVSFAAPMLAGGLMTADPLEPAVAGWWERTVADIYRIIPEFGGLLVKADSEGEPGPFTYGRNHDDGANLLARAISPYGGVIIWRCFVYNCRQDWRDRSIDRAKAQYETFIRLDGAFDDNVILQIKNGPIDFQVREPVSPLFGALKKTNQILEYQITQEYTGQQKAIFYLLPMWKTVLGHDTGADPTEGTVANTIRSGSPVKANCGIAAVVNVGTDQNWTGHKLAQANLYGFGRMVWNHHLSSEEILDEWLDLTFTLSPAGKDTLSRMMMTSGDTYEAYTAPNGIGFMVRPNHHYGPDVDGYEYDRWGTYHFADRDGIGVDRTLATGTGYARQYSDLRFAEYEDPASCPDELLLFFHHVPYTHRLRSGKTLIQSIYDTHFDGARQVKEYLADWQSLRSEMDDVAYENVRERLEEQHRCAREWRDQINTYFYRKSGIPDEQGRTIY